VGYPESPRSRAPLTVSMFPWKILDNFAHIRARTPLLHRDEGRPIFASGQTQSCGDVRDWSALPPIATNKRTSYEVGVVPTPDT
jgi:hypothetical protein